MTEGQLRYQTLMENQRHNYEVESYNREVAANQRLSAQAAKEQAEAATRNARVKEVEATISLYKTPHEVELLKAQTAYQSQYAKSRKAEVNSNIAFGIMSFLIPDANTALRSGAQVVSSLFK